MNCGPFHVATASFRTAEHYTRYTISVKLVRKNKLVDVTLRDQISQPDFDQCGSAAVAAMLDGIITRDEYNAICSTSVKAGAKPAPACKKVITARVPYFNEISRFNTRVPSPRSDYIGAH